MVSRPRALFQSRIASDAVIGAIRHTRKKRRRSRQRRRSGLMLSVTIEPQKIRISNAPASANSTAVQGRSPLTRAPARLAVYAGTRPQVGPIQTAASRLSTKAG